MEPSNQLKQFASGPGAAPRIENPFCPPQQHIQHSQRPQLVQHEYCHQAPPTSQQLVNEMSGMQLQDSMHTPMSHSKMPPLRSSFSQAMGISSQGPKVTQGLPRQSLMPMRTPQMGMPSRFSSPNQDHGVPSAGQQLGTPLPHPLQQQFSSPMSGRFPSAGHQLSHPSSMAQQPIQQGYQSGLQPQYPQHPPAAGIPGLMPQFPQQPVQYQFQVKELDSKSYPDAIQVMMKNEKDQSGPFLTHAKGLLPPMVTTNYVTQDRGNASPRFIRSSQYCVPESQEMLEESAVPFSIIITPFAPLEKGEFAPPIVDCITNGPVRCDRCKAYMCPFMKFIETGKKFYCPFCQTATKVPPEYFEHLDHTGMRTDKFKKPELCLGSYEFVVDEKYCQGGVLPKPPAVVFIIDVSYSSVRSGLVHLLCRNMKSILASLPRETPDGPRPKVGFITYSDQVHFYRIHPTLAQPEMKIVGDLGDMFFPMMDGFLEDPLEAAGLIEQLMIKIPEMFANTQEIETILGPAVEAGLEALKASGCAGKLLVFNTSLPVKEAPGRLKTKDEHKLLGTDREKTAFKPQTDYYEKLGKECVKSGVRVDLFLAHNGFIDLATIGQVVRLTSGQIYKYTPCRAVSDGELLMENGELVVEDVKQNLERTGAFDAIMRARTSLGIRPVGFYGNFFMSNTQEVELAGLDSDQAVTIELKHEGELSNQDGVYIQVSVLYTSVAGQRRIRVHNLSLNVSPNVEDLYLYCDQDAVMNTLLKQLVSEAKVSSPMAIKEGMISRAAQILASYRQNSLLSTITTNLLLPGSMPLLPLLVNSLLNCDAISGGEEMTVDARMFHMQSVMSMNVEASHLYLYSSIIPLLDHTLHQPVEGEFKSTPIRCSMDNLRDDGAYIIENGFSLYLWVGPLVDQHWIRCVFGVESAVHIDITKTRLEEFDNPQSRMVRDALAKVRGSRQRQMRLTIIRSRDKLEYECRKLLTEDRNIFNRSSLSYLFFTRLLHRKVQDLLPQ